PLAGILLYGARTFLDARTLRDCLANFPARSIAASPHRHPPSIERTRSGHPRQHAFNPVFKVRTEGAFPATPPDA
ncbi:MAG TPA: hypothetical protein PLC55_11675, partial [Zoogloea sp.]|nr:hypothetical protein [Zoogloea sp.]